MATGMKWRLIHADVIEGLRSLERESQDACVTDPPYELGFMGKSWDRSGIAHNLEVWTECLRVLKPGAHLLAFGGTRTYHRMACAIEDAGFEIRDCIVWLYGSGFPKSLNVSKAVDKMRGAERPRQVPQRRQRPSNAISNSGYGSDGWAPLSNDPITADASTWQGWGTALKPAMEPIVVARKPFKGTVAANVLAHGTGALNVSGCRIGDDVVQGGGGKFPNVYGEFGWVEPSYHTGRWPANVILDESAALALDAQSGIAVSDGASRFFYTAKADRKERNAGLRNEPHGNHHPTVKPIALMRWLIRLITPPGGTVLDPFCGSGSTGCASIGEGFSFTGIDNDQPSIEIARLRIREIAPLLSVEVSGQ